MASDPREDVIRALQQWRAGVQASREALQATLDHVTVAVDTLDRFCTNAKVQRQEEVKEQQQEVETKHDEEPIPEGDVLGKGEAAFPAARRPKPSA
eukprot:1821532-Rhodomonas_salina.1